MEYLSQALWVPPSMSMRSQSASIFPLISPMIIKEEIKLKIAREKTNIGATERISF